MKTEQPTLITSVIASTNLFKNLFVDFNGALPASDVKALGVVNADTDSGEQAPVMVEGIALVISNGAISKGSPVTTHSNGKAKQVTSTEIINGYALDSAWGVDELIRILLV